MKRLLLIASLFLMGGHDSYGVPKKLSKQSGNGTISLNLTPSEARALFSRDNRSFFTKAQANLIDGSCLFLYYAAGVGLSVAAAYALSHYEITIPIPWINNFFKIETRHQKELREKQEKLLLQNGEVDLEQKRDNLIHNLEIDVTLRHKEQCKARDEHGADSARYKDCAEDYRLALENLLATRKKFAEQIKQINTSNVLQEKPTGVISKEDAKKLLLQAQKA